MWRTIDLDPRTYCTYSDRSLTRVGWTVLTLFSCVSPLSVPPTTWEVGLTKTSVSGRKFKILFVLPSVLSCLAWPGGEMSESGGNADMELSDRMF